MIVVFELLYVRSVNVILAVISKRPDKGNIRILILPSEKFLTAYPFGMCVCRMLSVSTFQKQLRQSCINVVDNKVFIFHTEQPCVCDRSTAEKQITKRVRFRQVVYYPSRYGIFTAIVRQSVPQLSVSFPERRRLPLHVAVSSLMLVMHSLLSFPVSLTAKTVKLKEELPPFLG